MHFNVDPTTVPAHSGSPKWIYVTENNTFPDSFCYINNIMVAIPGGFSALAFRVFNTGALYSDVAISVGQNTIYISWSTDLTQAGQVGEVTTPINRYQTLTATVRDEVPIVFELSRSI